MGQQFVRLLAGHPWFKPTWLAASERSEGKAYGDAATWRLATPLPDDVRRHAGCTACTPGNGPQLVFSALDATVAGDLEPAFAAAGHIVVSNARNYRMDPAVPLLIPEINADHLALLRRQRRERGWKGAIVTNPNCSTIVPRDGAGAAAGVRPALGAWSTTLQAVSGAGYPGVPSLDILGNVVPFISGEEEKIESETQKILGGVADDARRAAPGDHQRADDARAGHRRAHRVDLGRASTRGRHRGRRPRRVAIVQRPAPGARAADRAARPPIDLRGADRPQPRLDAERAAA